MPVCRLFYLFYCDNTYHQGISALIFNAQIYQVTAKSRPNFIDMGNKITITIAIYKAPNAAAHAAFISIKAITPALTAFPIFLPTGSFMATDKGVKIIQANGSKKTSANKRVPFRNAKYRMNATTITYKNKAEYSVDLLPP
jgi:hypothetical protein